MAEPEDLRALGQRLDAVQRQGVKRDQPTPPSSMAIAFRFSTELVSALVVGGGLGWVLDHFLGTRPIFIVVMFVLGAAAGILNVIRAAREINAETSAKRDDAGDKAP